MRFEKTEVFNFGGAIRGMRNPLNSWGKSDSERLPNGDYRLGEEDLNLAKKLIKGGPEHRKFLRQIFVSVDITAPMYWYSEFDTYKVGTTANSTSKMHTLSKYPITKGCFEMGDYRGDKGIDDYWENQIKFLENLRQTVVDCKNPEDKKRYWKELLRLLPNSWLQTRTATLSYENIYSIYLQRRNHKLIEWSRDFVEWAESLPYFKELFLE